MPELSVDTKELFEAAEEMKKLLYQCDSVTQELDQVISCFHYQINSDGYDREVNGLITQSTNLKSTRENLASAANTLQQIAECYSMRTYLIEEKRLYEKGELKKKIVQVKKCGSSSQGGSYGVIEERNTVNTINITFRGDERKVYRYDRMAMLVEREDMEFFLIPTMEAERDSNQEKNSES